MLALSCFEIVTREWRVRQIRTEQHRQRAPLQGLSFRACRITSFQWIDALFAPGRHRLLPERELELRDAETALC